MSAHHTTYRAVVSDLHFGEGGSLENFVYEPRWLTFLDHVDARGRATGGSAELILNGDTVDFLQIAPLAHAPWREGKKKLEKTFDAHPGAFERLARFVADGNRVVVLVGNHDIELMFEEVQRGFVERLAKGLPEAAARVVFPNTAKLDAKRFRGWTEGAFVYQVEGAHIEHGNQADPVNCFDHAAFFEDDAKERLRLPWGSRFVYAVFNEAASRYRYLDKIRSKVAAGLLFWCLDPTLAKSLLPGMAPLGARWVNELKRFYLSRHTPVGGGARALEQSNEPALAMFGEWWQDLETTLKQPALTLPEGARGEPALRARLALLRGALKYNTIDLPPDTPDEYARTAFEIADREGVHTVIFGHTHGARDIRRDGQRYINSGTWIDRIDLEPLASALRQAGDHTWDQVAALLDPASFRSAPLSSFVELCGGEIALRSWDERGAR